MFPTTIWDVVKAAGGNDPVALDQLALEYRAPVLTFIRRRGIHGAVAEDLCQDVFVRLLTGNVLAKADAAKGRFRALLCTVTFRVIQDWARRQREIPSESLDPAVVEPDFDRVWTLHLVERALKHLKTFSPRSHQLLRQHLSGEPIDRNKLWAARQKLAAMIRREIAMTCRSSREVEDEIARLAPYLRPPKKSAEKNRDKAPGHANRTGEEDSA